MYTENFWRGTKRWEADILIGSLRSNLQPCVDKRSISRIRTFLSASADIIIIHVLNFKTTAIINLQLYNFTLDLLHKFRHYKNSYISQDDRGSYLPLNAIGAQSKNFPFGVNTTIEHRNIRTTSDTNGI
jgi:hypothetical protein